MKAGVIRLLVNNWVNPLLWMVVLLIVAGSPVQAEAPFMVEIPDEVVVSGSRFGLSDLGKITGGTEADRKLLESISFGTPPAPGQTRVFERKYLQLIVSGYRFQQIPELKMGERVTVRTAAVRISGPQLQAAIDRLIAKGKPGIVERWVELRNVPSNIWLAPGNWDVQAAPVGDLPLVGSAVFKVIITNGSETKTLHISGRIRAKALVYRSKRLLPRHTLLNEDEFEQITMELRTGKEFIGELPNYYRNLTVIREGDILLGHQIEEAPLVMKDQPVIMVVRHENFEIRIMGTACADGWMGDAIKIINTSSKKIVTGRVIDKDTVEVIVQ
ncbi:MAG TPA: flagellar basal body P-ring formation chaperone FlgA [Bacillota bacterium]|nr:flagellar basal body P-ring formation chaperone FlgA [Bacillota bacterium]HPT86768.1 flagellar basal body P-ring formation chaperone FlgA [Bacillota bacterium]